MKKTMFSIAVIVIAIIIGVVLIKYVNKNGLFTKSGLDKIQINEIIATDDVTGKVTNITDADAITRFLDELNSIEVPKENKKEEAHSGCNVPGRNKYYIELKSDNEKIVGDIIISKEGDIKVNNFENKYIKEIKDTGAANNLEKLIQTNINL
ncbi:hypothetical protein [Clostridium thermobutyricum]|uniref:hypothetical protein n=1 Tax=Clostridium thermobutyricum TaxID=29372 RepID=UPI0029431BD7|nr:hypothetical protein [Clostridium thermobutyricum]